MGRLILFILIALLLVVGWLFSAANGGEVVVNYLLGEQSARLSYWLLGVFLLGFLLGVIYCGASLVRIRVANKRLRERCMSQEQEILRLTTQAARSGTGPGA